MRVVGAVVVVTLACGVIAGIMISPDPIPTISTDLPGFLAANATKDSRYELIKGPPWQINLIGFLSKDPGSSTVTLAFSDPDDKLHASLQMIDVPVNGRRVSVQTSATIAAGFKSHVRYLVRLMVKTTVLAHAELRLSD